MKKAVSLILALVLCLSLCACGAEDETTIPETTIPIETEDNAPTVFEIGTIAATDQCEIDVRYCDFEDEWIFDDTVAHYEDKYFVVVEFFVRNVGKTQLSLSSIYPIVDYNDGYQFKIDFFEYKGKSYSPAFLYSNIGSLEPLSDAKRMKAAIIVPAEVVENTSAPLLINFFVPSTEGQQVLSFRVR